MPEPPVLEAVEVRKHFDQHPGILEGLLRRETSKIKAVDGVSISLGAEAFKGIIGESGCGKTTLLRTLLGLYEPTEGTVAFHGRDTREFDRSDWRNFRRNVRIIFQDPYESLNPRMTVEQILLEPLKIHGFDQVNQRVLETLENVELKPAEKYLNRRPKQLSGGERQRVAIARALVVDPDVVLADEPVSMLDVSTQAAILNLLSDLTKLYDVSLLYISHDLSTVATVCEEVYVMYLGRIVEQAPTQLIIENPKHPYTQALVNAIPIPNPYHDRNRIRLAGSPPDSVNIPPGCRFKDRCPERMPVCDTAPEFVETGDGQWAACHLYYDHEKRYDGVTQEQSNGRGMDP